MRNDREALNIMVLEVFTVVACIWLSVCTCDHIVRDSVAKTAGKKTEQRKSTQQHESWLSNIYSFMLPHINTHTNCQHEIEKNNHIDCYTLMLLNLLLIASILKMRACDNASGGALTHLLPACAIFIFSTISLTCLSLWSLVIWLNSDEGTDGLEWPRHLDCVLHWLPMQPQVALFDLVNIVVMFL